MNNLTPKNLLSVPSLVFALLLMGSGCTSDQLPEPTLSECGSLTPSYNVEIKPIIDQSCAYSGCHLDSAPGQYDTYEGLLSILENGDFRKFVITERADPSLGMPPNFAPAGRPKDLNEQEIELIDCWLQAGFPE